jgi:hypothetical protein
VASHSPVEGTITGSTPVRSAIICKVCKDPKDQGDFPPYVSARGKAGIRGTCRSCRSIDKKAGRVRKHRKPRAEYAAERSASNKYARKHNVDVPKFIMADSRRSDKKRGHHNDLDYEWIKSAIYSGCVYCGEQDLRMTLDRQDNDLGHIKTNVVPACIRCNIARRNMPLEAWLVVAEGMRKAKELGLFGTWTGRVR